MYYDEIMCNNLDVTVQFEGVTRVFGWVSVEVVYPFRHQQNNHAGPQCDVLRPELFAGCQCIKTV